MDEMFQTMDEVSSCVCVTLEGKSTTIPARCHRQGRKWEKSGVQPMGRVMMADCGNGLV